jgi:hypothetical protein
LLEISDLFGEFVHFIKLLQDNHLFVWEMEIVG